MNIKAFLKRCFGWCPGIESASEFSNDTSVSEKLLGVLGVLLLLIIPFSPLDGIYRFILMAFGVFIGIPICWRLIRGDKAGPQDGTYPDKAERPLPHEDFGEFNLDSPGAEASVYGPTRSTGSYDADMMISREWLHPDILWYRKRFLKKDEESEEEKP